MDIFEIITKKKLPEDRHKSSSYQLYRVNMILHTFMLGFLSFFAMVAISIFIMSTKPEQMPADMAIIISFGVPPLLMVIDIIDSVICRYNIYGYPTARDVG